MSAGGRELDMDSRCSGIWALAVLAVVLVAAPASAATYVISTTGSDSNPGTAAQPFATIQKAAGLAAAGDVIEVRGGVYRVAGTGLISFAASGTAGKPITLRAAAGENVTIRGSKVVTGWAKLSGTSVYRLSNWTYSFNFWDPKFQENPDQSGLDARSRGRNQVFVDGQIITEVAARKYMVPGTFYLDSAADQVDLWLADGGDPAGHLVEMTVTEGPLLTTNSQKFITIQNILFEHCANPAQDKAAVRLYSGTGCLMEDCQVKWMSGAGLTISGSFNVLRRTVCNNNGQLGIHSSRAVDCRVEQCETSHNNRQPNKEYRVQWEAGGNKFSRSRRLVVDGLLASDNKGSGIWFDIDLQDTTVTNCVSYGNSRGIHYEISYTGLITNNLCYDNNIQNADQVENTSRGLGIYISSSAGCWVYNNTIYGNDGYGLNIDMLVRDDGASRQVNGHSNKVLCNIIADNQRVENRVSYAVGVGVPLSQLTNSYMPVTPNVCDYNLFYLSGASKPFFVIAGSSTGIVAVNTLAAFQAAGGQDMHSRWADPKFVSVANKDFRLQPGSPAIDMGISITGVPVDSRGIARPQGSSHDAGLYEMEQPPRVVGVYVSGSAWNQNFLSAGAMSGTKGYAIPVGSGVELKPLPWSGIDRVRVVFDKNVIVGTGEVSLRGINQVIYASSLGYDPQTYTATLSLPSPIGIDKLQLIVFDKVGDTGFRTIDGEWSNPTSATDPNGDTYPSGNSAAGGSFYFRFDVLPGDVSQNGQVNSLDANPIRAGLSALVGNGAYSIFADVDGNGIINSLDANAVRLNLSQSLPTAQFQQASVPYQTSGFVEMAQ